MLRHTVLAAAVLVTLAPTLAHAEFISKKSTDIRPTTTVKPVREPLTIDTMLAKINSAYLTGMQRCYNRALAYDPSLRGKVTVTFTVNANGRVSGQATGIAPTVDACLTNAISTWRFAGAPRKEASFRISLVLSR